MKVPQINDNTGVSSDYWNQYYSKTIILPYGLKDLANWIREYPVKKYEERYPPEKYEEVITPKNRMAVKRLDELAILVNDTFTDPSRFTELDFKSVINEVSVLIWGLRLNPPYPEVETKP